MGAHLLPLPVAALSSSFLNPKFAVRKRRRFNHSPPAAAPRWDSNAETVRTRRFRFNNFLSDDDDGEDYESDFRREEGKRTWWSDDAEFELWEESPDGFDVIFKVRVKIFNYFFFVWDWIKLFSKNAQVFITPHVVAEKK